MEIDGQQNLRDDRMSDCRSFGSNYHPCSQSRKISIGVMVDSLNNIRSGATKEDGVAVPNAKKVTSDTENSIEGRKEGRGVTAGVIGKQIEAPEQESSPWINTRSFYQKTPTTETVHFAHRTSSFPSTSGMQNKLNRVKEAPTTYSVQFFANQTSILHSSNGKQKNFDRVTYKRRGGKDGTTERVEEFSFATAQEVLVSDKGVIEDAANKTENRSSEALRMKLWELLGTVPSPKKQFSDSQTLEMGANNLKPEQNFDKKGHKVAKPRQNSDTIETDSASPDHTIRRPVTRSLTRKRAPTKVQPNKTKNGPSSSYNQKHQENNIFSFEEGWSGRPHRALNGGSSMSNAKKSERKSCRIEPRKICFNEMDSVDKIRQATDRGETLSSAGRTSSLGSRMGGFHDCAPKSNREYVELKNGIQEKDSHQSPVTKKTDHLGDFNSSALPENADQQENFRNPSLKNIVDPQDDFQSPTFERKTPIKSSFHSSPPKTDQMEQGASSPTPAERRFTVGGIRSFKTLRTSKPDCYGSNEQSESSDDAGELNDSHIRKSAPIIEEKNTENGMSNSASEERDSESSEEGHRETFSPETGTAEKPKFMLRPTKRLRSHEDINFNEFSPTPPSPKGTEESNGFRGPSEQNQGNGLARAVALFALALERVKSKMKSVTSKKSSEILMSVAEGIYLQMQNVESQIQTDVGKLTSLSKSKRKHLETRFQEKQEQLKLIHEKFKEEVNQHLLDCRSTLEGLEAHQIEFKGTVERQKASHRKLLLQVEEAIETQLNDAQRRITAVHKLAKEKMLQLKHLIAECLEEGILS